MGIGLEWSLIRGIKVTLSLIQTREVFIWHPMSRKNKLPSLQEIIFKHLDASNPLDPDMQRLIVQQSKYKLDRFDIHHRHYKSLNKPSSERNKGTSSHNISRKITRPLSKKYGRVQSTKNIVLTDLKQTQKAQKQLQHAPLSLNQAPPIDSGRRNPATKGSNLAKTLSRFMFQFEVPEDTSNPVQTKRKVGMSAQRVHTMESYLQLKQAYKPEIRFRKTFISQPLNIQSKTICCTSSKLKSGSSFTSLQPKDRSGNIFRRQMTLPCVRDNPWELRPWVVSKQYET